LIRFFDGEPEVLYRKEWLMKSVIACCAVLTFACCGAATSASARNLFDGYILRPPASIPHGRGMHAAAAPLPRAKPVTPPRAAPEPVAASAAPLAFPPVQPLE
jgi:hypothetical protein